LRYRESKTEITLFARYAFFGGVGATCDFACFSGLTHLGVTLVFSNAIAICLGIGVSYFLNSKYTFQQAMYRVSFLIKFFAVGLSGLLISTLFIKYGSDSLHYSLPALKIVSIPFIAVYQFLLNRFWTFRRPG